MAKIILIIAAVHIVPFAIFESYISIENNIVEAISVKIKDTTQ